MVFVLLVFLLAAATFARDLSLHSSYVGTATDAGQQRTLREVTSDLMDALSMRHVEASAIRDAMNGGTSLKSYFLDVLVPAFVTASSIDADSSKPSEYRALLEDKSGTNGRTVSPSKIGASHPSIVATSPANRRFDFIVAGFPKCGTTTLLKAFGANPETDMVPQEQCAIAAPLLADDVVVSRLQATLLGMETIVKPESTWHKHGFKCPTAIYSYKSIVRLEKHSPNAKIVIGIRHPILMLESFYNYRVTELYERGLAGEEEIPSFPSLMDIYARPWKGLSLHSVRYEFFLQQLGKTFMDQSQLQAFADFSNYGYDLAIKPSNFTVFCYTVDQLEDTDESRSAVFRSTLQEYLGLTNQLAPFGHENKNYAVGSTGHPETIQICEDQFSAIRQSVLQYANQTSLWIRNHFSKSRDVVVANRNHFLESLIKWETDPCENENDNSRVTR